jgi:hypothetical protein
MATVQPDIIHCTPTSTDHHFRRIAMWRSMTGSISPWTFYSAMQSGLQDRRSSLMILSTSQCTPSGAALTENCQRHVGPISPPTLHCGTRWHMKPIFVDGICVVENDGSHGSREKAGIRVLDPGYHPIEIRYFQAGGAAVLNVTCQGPEILRQPLPIGKLFVQQNRN